MSKNRVVLAVLVVATAAVGLWLSPVGASEVRAVHADGTVVSEDADCDLASVSLSGVDAFKFGETSDLGAPAGRTGVAASAVVSLTEGVPSLSCGELGYTGKMRLNIVPTAGKPHHVDFRCLVENDGNLSLYNAKSVETDVTDQQPYTTEVLKCTVVKLIRPNAEGPFAVSLDVLMS